MDVTDHKVYDDTCDIPPEFQRLADDKAWRLRSSFDTIPHEAIAAIKRKVIESSTTEPIQIDPIHSAIDLLSERTRAGRRAVWEWYLTENMWRSCGSSL